MSSAPFTRWLLKLARLDDPIVYLSLDALLDLS